MSGLESGGDGMFGVHIRILLGIWGIIIICGAIESTLAFLSDGKAPKPISYQGWNRKLFKE